MNTKFAALAVLGTFSLLAAAPRAQAADNGFYLGVGATKTDFDITVDDVDGSGSFDDESFKVIAGFRPLDWLAVEANYIDLGGNGDGNGFTVESKAITASLLLIKEFQVVDLYARVGVAKWDADYAFQNLGSASEDGTEPTYGVGIGVHFGSVGVRAEWEKFSTDALDDQINTDISTLSVSFTYTFL